MDIETLEDLLKSRRSVRKWRSDEVPDEPLLKAIELATLAPNGGNYQGWHFYVVKNREVIRGMAGAVQAVADKVASWPEAEQWRETVERYRDTCAFFGEAPACIAVFTNRYESVMDQVLSQRLAFDPEAQAIDEFRRAAPTGIQSTAAAVTTMLLALHQMGLGAVWMAGPLIAKQEIEELVGAAPEQTLICLVAVGNPDDFSRRPRRPVGDVVTMVR